MPTRMANDPSREGLLTDCNEPRHSDENGPSISRPSPQAEFVPDGGTDDVGREPLSSRKPMSNLQAGQRPRWLFRASVNRRQWFIVCVIILVVLGAVVGTVTALVFKKYRHEPEYGLSPPWYPTPKGGTASRWKDAYEKAARMVSKMDLAEKMGLAVGTNGPAVHVGFGPLQLQDGPLGLRFADNATAWPAGITVGATWNRQLMYARGKAHGIEARQKGINTLLGPCVGPLGRMPAGGRNWEGFGADAYLQGIAAAETIRGIQSEGVMATIKHFVGNEQEHFRQAWEWGLPHALSSNIDDRTLHELYAWPFGDAVKAGVASVMCSYNMVNNSYACGNSKLLNGILKDELGFQGFVMSDWLAQRGGVSTALAGLDMTMPGDGVGWADGKSLWGPQLSKAVLNGSVPVERLNDMVTRIVAAWYQLGQDDAINFPRKPPNFSSWTKDRYGIIFPGSPDEQDRVQVNQYVNVQANHSVIAREVAAQGIVLLKNENMLPFSRQGFTDAKLRSRLDLIEHATGKRHQGKLKVGIFGEDAGPGDGPNFCADRGCNQGTLGSGWGSGAVEFPHLTPPIELLREQFNASRVDLHEYLTNTPSLDNGSTVSELEVCIVFANSDSGEGFIKWEDVAGDRPNLDLQKGTDDLIVNVAARCGNGLGEVVVVVHNVGPVIMERWIDLPNVKAVLLANLPGQESGTSLTDVLFGDVNPSGHLPYTIGRSLDDYGPGAKVLYYPNGVVPQQDFTEGLYIDYRHFDKYEIEPRFAFGFGLSYTAFEVANVTVTQIRAKTALPSPRPSGVEPPSYPTDIPPRTEALFPEGFRRLTKYIYPYLNSTDDISSGSYPYPDGYRAPQPRSEAGGDEGGNPDLWQAYVTVRADVRNVGARPGAAVVQVYMKYPPSTTVEFPVKVLRGFDKVWLEQWERKEVSFNLTRRDLSYWDVERQNWVMVREGRYEFLIGQSSRDLGANGYW